MSFEPGGRVKHGTLFAALALSVMTVACGGDRSAGGIVYDTIGGVPAVMNPYEGTLGDSLPWALTQYLLVAGDQLYDGEPAVYALDVAILPGGGVVVLDAGNRRVLRFDSAGVYIGQFGGAGDGPGQFASPLFIEVADSLVYVVDPGLNRLTAFDTSGIFVSRFQIEFGGLVGTTPLFETGAPHEIYMAAEPAPFLAEARDTGRAVIYRLDRSGAIGDTVLTYPASSWTRVDRPDGGSSFVKPRLAPEPKLAATPGVVAVGTAAQYLIEIRRPDGALLRRIARAYDNVAVTVELRDSVLDRLAQGPGRLLREQLDLVPFAPVVPAIEGLVLDDEGRLWVDVYAAGEPTRRDVFDAEGRFLGPLYLPQPVRLEEVRVGRACGVMSEITGQAAVVCYRVDT